MITAEGDISNFENAVICHICDKGFNDEDRKVRAYQGNQKLSGSFRQQIIANFHRGDDFVAEFRLPSSKLKLAGSSYYPSTTAIFFEDGLAIFLFVLFLLSN